MLLAKFSTEIFKIHSLRLFTYIWALVILAKFQEPIKSIESVIQAEQKNAVSGCLAAFFSDTVFSDVYVQNCHSLLIIWYTVFYVFPSGGFSLFTQHISKKTLTCSLFALTQSKSPSLSVVPNQCAVWLWGTCYSTYDL